MTSNPSIGVAVVGTGFGQKVHIPALRDCPGTHIVALYNRDLAKAQAIAAQHNIPHASDALEDIVALPEVEAVALSTPPFLHYEMAQTILKAGKHLFLEKPTTLAASEAQTLYELTQQQGLQIALNFEFRFVPAWMQLKALLEQNYVGATRLIKIDWLVGGRGDPARPWSWHVNKAAGGGSLGALGSHTFDYISWLFGPIKRLSARLITTIPERPDPETGALKAADADDTCVLMVELMSGTICQVSISATTYAGRGHWVEVYGERGTLVLGMNNPKDYVHGFELQGSQGGAALERIEIPAKFAFEHTYPDGRIAPTLRVVDHWVQMIHRGQSAPPSIQEGVYTQILMDAAQKSSETGTWVDIPEQGSQILHWPL